MSRIFFRAVGFVTGCILGIAIIVTIIIVREKNINNKIYLP